MYEPVKIYDRIDHPDWLKEHAWPQLEKCMQLFLAGNLPKSISGWMIVTALKHMLRCLYGSDEDAIIELLRQKRDGVKMEHQIAIEELNKLHAHE